MCISPNLAKQNLWVWDTNEGMFTNLVIFMLNHEEKEKRTQHLLIWFKWQTQCIFYLSLCWILLFLYILVLLYPRKQRFRESKILWFIKGHVSIQNSANNLWQKMLSIWSILRVIFRMRGVRTTRLVFSHHLEYAFPMKVKSINCPFLKC